MKVVYTPQAAADIAEIFHNIQQKHPQGAMNVKKSIHASIELLEHFPYIGVKTNLPSVRRLVVPHYSYLIFYAILERRDEVSIVAVRHSSRQR